MLEQESIFSKNTEGWIDTDELDTEEQKQGNRLSISAMEKVIPIYDIFNELINEENDEYNALRFLVKIHKEKKEEDISEVVRNAKASIRGTQLHNLQYFHSLFSRVTRLGRDVEREDILKTFPYQKKGYNNGLYRVLEIAREENDLDILGYWNTWRMNGHDFSIPHNSSTLINPYEMLELWESGVAEKDIDEFFRNVKKIDEEELNPHNSLRINEVMCITNFSFEQSTLQVPSFLDEITIPRNFPDSPIIIVDYKTGKEFRKPSKIEKIQIFLMMNSVLANIVDVANSIQWPGQKDWDIAHDGFPLPSVTKKSLIGFPIGFLHASEIFCMRDYLKENIQFRYVNPLTQKYIVIEPNDIGIDSEEGIIDMLEYLEKLNTFYAKNKIILSPILRKGKFTPYILPKFPYDGFDKGNIAGESFQSPLF